ncbi:MAG: DUF748 domain-containing protein, partial [Merismopedia sp. SIO2A8]|nr:DUF748 domain-containing protein [Merismopedia sp. SIO2A8]
MTQTPSPDPTPESNSPMTSESANPPSKRSRWIKLGIGAAIVLTAGIGYWRLRVYVYTQLVPQIESTLLKMIDRPVEMGAVEGFSPIGIRFGPTTLPATPTDTDAAIANAIQVHFNPLTLLIRQELNLRLTLVEAAAALDQDISGQWFNTQINTLEPGPIEIKLRQINLKNATVSLQPFAPSFESPPPSIILGNINGQVQLRDDNQRFLIDVEGEPNAGGAFRINGDVQLATSDPLDIPLLFDGRIETDRLPLAALAPLGADYVPAQFGQITHGFLNSGVTIRVPNPADTRALAPDLELWGSAEIWDLSLKIPGLPSPIEKGNGRFVFKGERINLRSGEARYGTIRANASGRIHLQDGYSIKASIPSAPIADILAATQLTLPIAAKGAFESQLRLTGPLADPLVTGLIKNKNKIWVDNLRLDTVKARIRATTQTLNINTIEA